MLTCALPHLFQNGYEYKDSTEAFYQTFHPECDDETAVDQEVVDVVLSGKVNTCSQSPWTVPPIFIFQAESQLEPAWGNCEFWGRVRVSDGLVVLVQHVVRYHHATSH